MLDIMQTIIEAIKEIAIAYQGGDWGYGSLAELVGESNARAIVNMWG